MNRLLRELAPVSDTAWSALEAEARQVLAATLAGRRVVDFSGPHGWEHSATPLGRTTPVENLPAEGVRAAARRVLPLIELRAEFSLPRAELADAERGADTLDLGPLDAAAREIARIENIAIFHGLASAGISGITDASGHQPVRVGDEFHSDARHVATAVETLRRSGVDGPYALALSPDAYTRVVETAEHGGVLLLKHLRQILRGPVIWAPGVSGAVVLSTRGGDFHFTSGEDFSLGYRSHDGNEVCLFLEESFSFHVSTPEAAIALAT